MKRFLHRWLCLSALLILSVLLCACGAPEAPTPSCEEHSWDEGGFASEEDVPLCGERTEGIKTYTCLVCGEVRTEPVYNDARMHSTTTETTKKPTCTEEGIRTTTCKICGYQRHSPIQADSPHRYDMADYEVQGEYRLYHCLKCEEPELVPPVVSYKDFGAISGDGLCDHEAMRQTHEYANLWGIPVEAEAGAEYDVRLISDPAIIMTDVDWKGATFIIHDELIHWNNTQQRGKNIFLVKRATASQSLSVPEGTSLSEGQANIGFAPGFACMLEIRDANSIIYERYGINSGNAVKHEMILVDAEGNVDPSTPIQYDYETLTSAVAYSIDDEPITIKNANMRTITCDPRLLDENFTTNGYHYVARGLRIERANVTVDGVNHTKIGEHLVKDNDYYNDFGLPYSGFYYVRYAYNVTVQNASVWGHQAYSFKDGNARNEMGSYELGGSESVNIRYINLRQEGDITDRRNLHGVMGTNYCRNFYVENCYLDRFDSHQGLHNATLKNSTFGFGILVIGGGRLYMENVTRLTGGAFVSLRSDYNSIFRGEIMLKNCTAGASITTLVEGTWRDFYNGLPNYIGTEIVVDGLTVQSGSLRVYNLKGATAAALTNATNPLLAPTAITVGGVTGVSSVSLCSPEQRGAFSNTVLNGVK